MNESERPSTPATPESVWKSINGKEEANMDITFTPDQLCAMARSRERESTWSRRILLMLLIGLAGAFAYNVLSVSLLWLRLSQGWMLAWTCLLVWRFRRGPRRMTATDDCASFLRREFEGKRRGTAGNPAVHVPAHPSGSRILVGRWARDPAAGAGRRSSLSAL